MTERVLTLRELNRATLARQLPLKRKRLSPTAGIDPASRSSGTGPSMMSKTEFLEQDLTGEGEEN